MAVGDVDTNSNLNSLLEGAKMNNLLGGGQGEGLGGGVLLGLLLGRSGILGGDNNALSSEKAAIDAAVASALASANQANNNAMLLLKDIQDTGQGLTATITAGNQDLMTSQLQGQISNLQGQSGILSAVDNSKASVINEIHENASDGINALNQVAGAMAAGFNSLNTNLLQGNASLAQVVTNDGDKTRALVQSIETANLQRQLGVAEARLMHQENAGLIRSGNVDVITNVNQNQIQTQQQQQQLATNSLLGQLISTIQHNTNSIVNLGTITGTSQAATAVRT
jgi:hypothetical protein